MNNDKWHWGVKWHGRVSGHNDIFNIMASYDMIHVDTMSRDICHDIMASQKINDQCYYWTTGLMITHTIVRVFNGHDDTWPEFLFHHHITRVNTFNFPIDCFTTLVHVLYCWRWRQWGCLSSSVSHDDMIHTADSGRSSTKTETLLHSRNNSVKGMHNAYCRHPVPIWLKAAKK